MLFPGELKPKAPGTPVLPLSSANPQQVPALGLALAWALGGAREDQTCPPSGAPGQDIDLGLWLSVPRTRWIRPGPLWLSEEVADKLGGASERPR